jgi:peroxiredoxin Q/BCP
MAVKTLKFAWPDQDGNLVSNKSLAGTPYVLYFYPKDDTPGCTKEACGIRDAWSDFRKAGLKVYGVSKDSADRHHKFRVKYNLPFDLLIAPEEDLAKLGVWREKHLYGRTYMGIARETFLVGVDGKVLKHYEKVKPDEHATQLLADYAALA